jgi:hypothetical protein
MNIEAVPDLWAVAHQEPKANVERSLGMEVGEFSPLVQGLSALLDERGEVASNPLQIARAENPSQNDEAIALEPAPRVRV